MSSDTDRLGRSRQDRIRAASTVVLGVAGLVLLAVFVSLLPAAVTDVTALGLLGVLGLGLVGYVGWGVATLVRSSHGHRREGISERGSLVQWTVVLTVLLVVYTALGPVVTLLLGDSGVIYDVAFLLVAAVPVVAIATCLRRSRSGENSFAETIDAIRDDLNPDRPTDPGDDD